MKDWTLVRILFSKLSPDPKSNINSLGWRAALARFSEPENDKRLDPILNLQSGTRLSANPIPSFLGLIILVDSPVLKIWSSNVCLRQKATPNLVPPVYFFGFTFCPSQPLTLCSSWTKRLIPAQTHPLLFTPPASIHSVPASQYAPLPFSRNSDCFLHISMFLRPNTRSLQPKNTWLEK